MIGTILNVSGILIGGVAGLARRRAFSPALQGYLKIALGAFTVFYGLRLTWQSLEGPLGHLLLQMGVAVLAMMLGKLLGALLRLQAMSNAIGRAARERIAAAQSSGKRPAGEGFRTCAALFCVAPLGILGAIQDGLSGYYYTLGVKAVIEGLAAMGFVLVFGREVILAALPVLAFQGSITLGCAYLRPLLEAHQMVNSINVVGGLLVFATALIILDLKKVEVADYVPSLAIAPLIGALVFR